MYYRDHSKKTAAYRDWESEALFELGKAAPQAALKELREAFDAEKHVYRMRIVCKYPRQNFLTQKGLLSTKMFDVTNTEKIICDLVFLPKYHVQAFPYGVPNLNVDDKFLLSLNSAKRCSSEDKYEIQIDLWLENFEKYKK